MKQFGVTYSEEEAWLEGKNPMIQYHNLQAFSGLPTLAEPIYHIHLYVWWIKETKG